MLHEAELPSLARLHAECLPDSLVANLGPSYVASFYRYLAQSGREIVCVERQHGLIVAAAVVTLEPQTLTRRLLRHTPLAPGLIRHGMNVWQAVRRTAGEGTETAASLAPTTVPPAMPELILLFTAPASRGAGWGSRVLARIETELRARGVLTYQVRTEARRSNRALDFYLRRGFEASGGAVRFGTPFQVFIRHLS